MIDTKPANMVDAGHRVQGSASGPREHLLGPKIHARPGVAAWKTSRCLMSLDMLGVEITIVLPLFDGLYKKTLWYGFGAKLVTVALKFHA